jgi:hypothetical protein
MVMLRYIYEKCSLSSLCLREITITASDPVRCRIFKVLSFAVIDDNCWSHAYCFFHFGTRLHRWGILNFLAVVMWLPVECGLASHLNDEDRLVPCHFQIAFASNVKNVSSIVKY